MPNVSTVDLTLTLVFLLILDGYLAVTDANLVLGRIMPEYVFEF